MGVLDLVIPRTTDKLIEYFEELLREFNVNLEFWRQRVEPTNQKEMDRENSTHWNSISKVPYKLRPRKGAISNEEAKKYWFDRIGDVNRKLELIRKDNNVHIKPAANTGI